MRVLDLPVPHEDGSFVSQKISRIVELIREYAPGQLDVRWIPPGARGPGDAAFCIVELTDEGWRTVMTVKDEKDMHEGVLARIYQADSRVNDPSQRLAALQRVRDDVERKEWEDKIAQAHDEAEFLWKTPKHTVRFKDRKLNL